MSDAPTWAHVVTVTLALIGLTTSLIGFMLVKRRGFFVLTALVNAVVLALNAATLWSRFGS